MASWGATEAKAKFSEVLDRAEAEGPQVVRRRRREFVVMTKEQMEKRSGGRGDEAKPFVNAWDALRPPDELLSDYELPRPQWKPRKLGL